MKALTIVVVVHSNTPMMTRIASAPRWRGLLPSVLAVIAVSGHLALAAPIVPTSGLVGYWAGDGNTNDSSINGNNGSFSGTYAPGRVGEAFQVGGGSHVSIPDISAYTFSTAFSVGLWFQGDGGGVYVGQDDGGGGQNKWFADYGYFNSGSFELFEYAVGGNVGAPPSIPVTLSGNSWHHLAVVKDNTTYTFYLDGSAIGSSANPNTFPDPVAPFTIGYAEPNVPAFNGLIDEVVLYNRALSAGEVQQLADVPEPSTSALLAAAAGSLALRRRRRRA